MDTITIDDTLRTSSFTAGLGRSEHRRLAALATRRTFAPGEVVLREGDETPFLGIVASGRLGLRLLVPDRGPITILTVEPGDVFGWSAVVPPYRSSSTAVAVEPTEAICFEAAVLRDALERDDDLAAAIHPRLLKLVARRLDATRLQLLDLFGSTGDRAW